MPDVTKPGTGGKRYNPLTKRWEEAPASPPSGTAPAAPPAEKTEDEEWQDTLPPNRRGIGGAAWRSSPEGKAARDKWRSQRQKRSAAEGAAAIGASK